MLGFEKIDLKPLSWQILEFIAAKPPMKADAIAEALQLGTRQVDAAVTKSLVRYGFVVREAKLTKVMKKEYNMIKVTPTGSAFVEWKLTQAATQAAE